MEAAKVRAGLEPSQPIPKGMPILWSKNMQKTRRRLDRRHAWTATTRANALHQWTTVVIRRDLGAVTRCTGKVATGSSFASRECDWDKSIRTVNAILSLLRCRAGVMSLAD